MPPAPVARTVVLDNEAVQALLSPSHPKHRAVLAHMEVAAVRNRRRSRSHLVVVPTAVRVEAGWDRRAAPAATANRLPIADRDLDTAAADRAAHLVGILGVSPAEAHIGAVIGSAPGPVTVLTSDVDDVGQIVGSVGGGARIVPI